MDDKKYYYKQLVGLGFNYEGVSVQFKKENGNISTKWMNITPSSCEAICSYFSLILGEDVPLDTKRDFIAKILKEDDEIDEIDEAIPSSVQSSLLTLGVSFDNLAVAYFKNGNTKIINVIEHYVIINKKNKG